MPLYDYKCPTCEKVKEYKHSAYEKPQIICDSCNGEVAMEKTITYFPLHFKGSGFYETDYKRK